MNKKLIKITNKAIIDAKLDDLSWAMHKEGCCENDVLGLIEHIENFINKGGTPK